MTAPGPLGCPCGGAHLERVFLYDSPPAGETRFDLGGARYRREVRCCQLCRHFVSSHDMDLAALYRRDYVESTYGGAEGLRRSFERIAGLPEEKSDNAGRVRRIVSFADARDPARARRTVLDVGSGLCVFLARMSQAGWDGTALDPDPRAARHARETVGVRAIEGDFNELAELGRYDMITFNKVLEHVADPVGMLARAARHLNPGGHVYVELPDGELAAQDGPGREEFFIEHLHVFSAASLALLAGRAGFEVVELERLREPSSKYTLRAFLRPAAGAAPLRA